LLATIERLVDDGGVFASTDTLLTKATKIAERHTIFVYDAAYAAAETKAAITSLAATNAT
jgi:predicted nucleic acid-binding protein